MRQPGARLVGYCSRVVAGLVGCAVIASMLHTEAAAMTLLAAAMLLVLTITSVMFRDGG